MAELNPDQLAAAQHVEGPLLILAGAGAGKTSVLTHRIARLVLGAHAAPAEIMAVTFTNKAATELKKRLEALLGGLGLTGMWVGTFHGLCARLLRRELPEWPGAPIGKNFVIFDDTEQLAIVRGGIKALGLDDKLYPARGVLAKISNAKSHGLGPDDLHERARSFQQANLARLYTHYQTELRRQNGVDFDDLLLLAVALLEAVPEVRERYARRFKHVLVDEFQDTNATQYRLVKLLSSHHRNLCVVGDVDQSIYSFRAADFRILLQFQQDFPDATIVKLEQNYRSTGAILEAANGLIEHNTERFEKVLWTKAERGEPVRVHTAYDDRDEAEFVLLEIERRRERPLSDFAVLYRTNAQSRALEEQFLRHGVPYRLVGGIRFYERAEIKDLLAYARLVHNPADEAAFARAVNVPKRGIGRTTIERALAGASRAGRPIIPYLAEADAATLGVAPKTTAKLIDFARRILAWGERLDGGESLADWFRALVEESGYAAMLREEGTEEAMGRLENVMELVAVAAEFVGGAEDAELGAFLTHLALLSDLDAATRGDAERQDAVTLMTIHAAKGLEFPVVFSTGWEEGVFPHKRTLEDPAGIEEERRLAYVAITRAEEGLTIVHAQRRVWYGEAQRAVPSRFLAELPESALSRTVSPMAAPRADSWAEAAEAASGAARRGADRFLDEGAGASSAARFRRGGPRLDPNKVSVGDRLTHERFGTGRVERIMGSGDMLTFAIAFPGYGTRVLDPGLAPLARVAAMDGDFLE